MTSDPRFRKFLTPARNRLSMQEGHLECKISEKELLIPVVLKKPGLHSFKVLVECQTPKNGPICRTDMISLNVSTGKADPKLTKVTTTALLKDKLKGTLINITPLNSNGHLLGPGYSDEFKVMVGKQSLEVEIDDQLDGTYQIEVLIPDRERKKVKDKRVSVNLTFQEKPIWKGML